MVHMHRYIAFLMVLGTPFCVQTARLIDLTFKRDKDSYTLSLQPADHKPLFILPTQTDSLLNAFFDKTKTTFTFDSQRMMPTSQKKPTAAPPIESQQASIAVSDQAATGGQEDEAPPTISSGQEDAPAVTPASQETELKEIAPAKEHIEIAPQSYLDIIEHMTLQEAEAILKRQPYTMQAQFYVNYVARTIWKYDPIARAKALARTALNTFNGTMKTLSPEKVKNFDITNAKQLSDKPLVRKIYNAIRTLGLVIGYEMPNIDPWYVEHKGKIALTAGTVALLALAHYSNMFGTRTITPKQDLPIMTSKTTVPITKQIPTPAQSWFSKSLAAAKTKLGNVMSGAAKTAGSAAQKETSKALVSRIAKHHGIGPKGNVSQPLENDIAQKLFDPFGEAPHQHKPLSIDLKHTAGDITGHALTQELAESYGYELVPKAGSTISRPPSVPPALRGEIVKKLLDPQYGDLEQSFRNWK